MTTTTTQHQHLHQHSPTEVARPPAGVLAVVAAMALTVTVWGAVLLAGLAANPETIELAPAQAAPEQATT